MAAISPSSLTASLTFVLLRKHLLHALDLVLDALLDRQRQMRLGVVGAQLRLQLVGQEMLGQLVAEGIEGFAGHDFTQPLA
jgi:hypothetical protein